MSVLYSTTTFFRINAFVYSSYILRFVTGLCLYSNLCIYIQFVDSLKTPVQADASDRDEIKE